MTIRSEADIRSDIQEVDATLSRLVSMGVAEVDSPEGDGSITHFSLSQLEARRDSLYKELSIVVRSGSGYSGSHLASFERGS